MATHHGRAQTRGEQRDGGERRRFERVRQAHGNAEPQDLALRRPPRPGSADREAPVELAAPHVPEAHQEHGPERDDRGHGGTRRSIPWQPETAEDERIAEAYLEN